MIAPLTGGDLGCKVSFVTIKIEFQHNAKEIVPLTNGVLACKVSYVTIKKEFDHKAKEIAYQSSLAELGGV